MTEILVVIVVVGILAGTAFLAFGPQARKRAQEARATSDLRQIVAAINLYLADNDDRFPLSMNSLPPQTPKVSPTGQAYAYMMHWADQRRQDQLQMKYRFDRSTSYIVRDWSIYRQERHLSAIPTVIDSKGTLAALQGYRTWSLSGFLDGSVRFSEDQFWDEERRWHPVPRRVWEPPARPSDLSTQGLVSP